MSISCRTVRSVQPGLRGLVVSVGEDVFSDLGGALPPEGTLYGSIAFKSIHSRDYAKKFANFVYLGQGEDTRDGGTLLFGPNKTAAQINAPFRTTIDYKDFYWDTILLALVFIRDPLGRSGAYISNTAAGIAVGPRYRVREVYIPGGEMGTTFITREYLSPTPFPAPSFETPVPRAVTYDVPGARGGFPSCIGPRIVIPNLESGVVTAVAGTISGLGGSLKGQIFPETNVIDWEPRVISFEQKLTPGGYHGVEVSVIPPEQPEIVIS